MAFPEQGRFHGTIAATDENTAILERHHSRFRGFACRQEAEKIQRLAICNAPHAGPDMQGAELPAYFLLGFAPVYPAVGMGKKAAAGGPRFVLRHGLDLACQPSRQGVRQQRCAQGGQRDAGGEQFNYQAGEQY